VETGFPLANKRGNAFCAEIMLKRRKPCDREREVVAG
jgi:hypothetical protein